MVLTGSSFVKDSLEHPPLLTGIPMSPSCHEMSSPCHVSGERRSKGFPYGENGVRYEKG
jgi:hypothetical protein